MGVGDGGIGDCGCALPQGNAGGRSVHGAVANVKRTKASTAYVSSAVRVGAGDIADRVGASPVCDAATGRVGVRGDGVGCGARIRNSGNVGELERARPGRVFGDGGSNSSRECAGVDVYRTGDCVYGWA